MQVLEISLQVWGIKDRNVHRFCHFQPCCHPNPSSWPHLCDVTMYTSVSRHRGGCKCRSTCLEALRCALIRHRVNEAVDLHPLPNERVPGRESSGRKVEVRYSRGISHSGSSDLASLVKEFRAEKVLRRCHRVACNGDVSEIV